MTAQELHSEIANTVRHRVSEEEYRTRVASTAGACSDCGPTYTHDLLARLSLNRTAGASEPAVPAAGSLADKSAQLDGDVRRAASSAAGSEVPPRSIASLFPASGVVLAVIVAAAAVAIIMRESEAEGGIEVVAAPTADPVVVDASRPKNLFNEATATYRRVATGEIGVQVEGPARRDVERHFAAKGVSHQVRFPALALPLAGGIVTRYGDRNVAQLVYATEGQAVYVLQVPTAEVRKGTSLYVTEDVLARLEQGDRIVEETAEGEVMIVFRDDDLVMAVVSNLDRARLGRMLGLE